jgi:type II secretory pathway component PulF
METKKKGISKWGWIAVVIIIIIIIAAYYLYK